MCFSSRIPQTFAVPEVEFRTKPNEEVSTAAYSRPSILHKHSSRTHISHEPHTSVFDIATSPVGRLSMASHVLTPHCRSLSSPNPTNFAVSLYVLRLQLNIAQSDVCNVALSY